MFSISDIYSLPLLGTRCIQIHFLNTNGCYVRYYTAKSRSFIPSTVEHALHNHGSQGKRHYKLNHFIGIPPPWGPSGSAIQPLNAYKTCNLFKGLDANFYALDSAYCASFPLKDYRHISMTTTVANITYS
jgi:hypothetical protein